MKINISCQSLILQKTLSLYLREYLSNYDNCDFVICDFVRNDLNKPVCLAVFNENTNIRRPMHKESLFEDITKFYTMINKSYEDQKMRDIFDINELVDIKKSLDSINTNKSIDPLKEQIDNIFQDFANKLYDVIKKNNA